ncbi:MAG: hypothetical protein GX137_06605 [Thermoplasmatales archaeon]|nr:hypothetical protein [Thermoplasmatales archaeon]
MSSSRQVECRDKLTGILALIAGVILFAIMLYCGTGTYWVLGNESFIPYMNSNTVYEHVFSAGITISGVLIALYGTDLLLLRRNGVLSASGIFFIITGITAMYLTTIVTSWDFHGDLMIVMALSALISVILLTANDWMDGRFFTGGVSMVLIFAVFALLATNGIFEIYIPAMYGFSAWLVLQGVKCLSGKPTINK